MTRLTLEHRKKLSEAKKKFYKIHGNEIGFKQGKDNVLWKGGKPKCKICGKELSHYNSKTCIKCFTGKNHPRWITKDVGYRTLHLWVERILGKPDKCEFCGKENLSGHKIHWANKSGKYLRKLNDWIRLCKKCHYAYDKR